MKEVLIHAGPRAQIAHVPIHKPNALQVVILVMVSGLNPKDWKMPEWFNNVTNQGDDIAGIVASVGEEITEFKQGDRVAVFHEVGALPCKESRNVAMHVRSVSSTFKGYNHRM